MSRYLCEDCGRPFIEAFKTHDGKWCDDCDHAVCALCDESSGAHVACVVGVCGWVRHEEHGLICEDCACSLTLCKTCGGSGGGIERFACSVCHGTGKRHVERDSHD